MSTTPSPTSPSQSTSISPHGEEASKQTDPGKIPVAKLTALQRLNSIIRKQDPLPKFPPDSWTTEGIAAGGAEGSDAVPELISTDRVPVTSPTVETPTDAPEPQTLANRIRLTLANAVAPSDAAASPSDGTSTLSLDEKFKTWLSSDSVMNGAGATSVWACLDRLNPMKPKGDVQATSTSLSAKDGTDTDDDSSFMMYGPLEPTPDSKVQIAKKEIVEEDGEYPEHKESSPSTSDGNAGGDKTPKAKVKKVWIPSPTQISLETAWWGYRIYLPPPVMERLNSYQPIAAKKAAVISTSLKWILDKVPTLMVPPPLRPALMLLKRLTPYLGSIGVFVAWSWGRISTQDKGHGVYLSATWLLPVALIPSTWDTVRFPPSEDTKDPGQSSQKTSDGPASEPVSPAEAVDQSDKAKGSKFSLFGSLKGKKKAE